MCAQLSAGLPSVSYSLAYTESPRNTGSAARLSLVLSGSEAMCRQQSHMPKESLHFPQ